ncbi:Glyoxalase/Bleomycin resistance protein/Dihydroxybiphenyl dioxygenase [Gaertneriomyces semiglobifer]|nr:Glyoxalase/Bleomycin resistance protein/Dihydroxybiphenyl dioxygenase [Gaertneriomyces semiglobifer]
MATYDASFLGSASPFVQEVIATLESNHVPVHYKMDHVCYRTSAPSEYSDLKALLSTLGDLLIESEIGGRDISTYKLRDDLAIRVPGREGGGDRVIDVLELPAPKPGRNYQSGWEHVELVVDDMSLEEFMAEGCEISL